MKKFTIEANNFLSQNTNAYFHSDYVGGGRYRTSGTIEYAIFSLKGEAWWCSPHDIEDSKKKIAAILKEDIASIVEKYPSRRFTVCATPRSKVFLESSKMQLFYTIYDVVSSLNSVDNGVGYIQRLKNTYTTHKISFDGGGDGDKPYPGITMDTCTISEDVKGRDILLIDDIYTVGVNIDEDAIEALLRKGANSVIFYSVGRTVSRY